MRISLHLDFYHENGCQKNPHFNRNTLIKPTEMENIKVRQN